jgi:hypothetical protein
LTDAALAIEYDRDFFIGTGDCDREIVLYGDYTSDACRRLRDILRRIAERLTGRIDYSYRQFPNSEDADSIRASESVWKLQASDFLAGRRRAAWF